MNSTEFYYYSKMINDPKGYSNDCYPGGLPKSNMEAYRDRYVEEYVRRNDYH